MRPALKLCVVVLIALASTAFAVTPEENFDKLYGEQAKKAQALRDPKATADFLKGLIKDAGDLKDDPKFQVVVFTRAYDIAMRVADYALAQDAMEQLAAAQPALRSVTDEKLGLALERDHRPGMRAKFEVIKARLTAAKRVEQLELTMRRSPNKRDAAELVRLQLLEFDDPVKAATYIPDSGDDALKRIVGLASAPAAELSEQDAKDLGDWYFARSKTGSANARAIALGRAKGNYERFLSLHAANDALRLEVKRQLDALGTIEAATGGSSSAGASGKWIDLLAMINPAKHAKAGTWKLDNGVLTSGNELGARIQIPYMPPDEYDYRIVFSRNEGSAPVLQFAARGDQEMVWNIGWRNSAMFALNDKDVDQVCGIKNGVKYTSLIKVRHGSVQFLLNDRLILDEKDEGKLFEHGLWMHLENEKLLGIGSHLSPTSFYRVEIREISGQGKSVP